MSQNRTETNRGKFLRETLADLHRGLAKGTSPVLAYAALIDALEQPQPLAAAVVARPSLWDRLRATFQRS